MINLTDLVGYSALVINLYSMTRSNVDQLRLFSLIANSVYIIYGILLLAFPLIIGCSIAVGLHSYHLTRQSSKKSKHE